MQWQDRHALGSRGGEIRRAVASCVRYCVLCVLVGRVAYCVLPRLGNTHLPWSPWSNPEISQAADPKYWPPFAS
jgi:hypothetical protein